MRKYLAILGLLVTMNYGLDMIHGAMAWMKVPSELKHWQNAESESICIKDCSYKATHAEYIKAQKNEDGEMIPAENVVHFEVRLTKIDEYGGYVDATLSFYDSKGHEFCNLRCHGMSDKGKSVAVTLTGSVSLEDVRKEELSKATISVACKKKPESIPQ